jgi:hypothetical protein
MWLHNLKQSLLRHQLRATSYRVTLYALFPFYEHSWYRMAYLMPLSEHYTQLALQRRVAGRSIAQSSGVQRYTIETSQKDIYNYTDC